jgi:guanylate kinase
LSPKAKAEAAPTRARAQARLIVLSAPSGGGKTTLARMLLEHHPNVVKSISTTTRPRRPNEIDGVHYHFVTPAEFQKRIDKGEFAEWAEVHGNRYGTSRHTIDDALTKGKHVLFDIDYQGAMSLRKAYGDRTLLIFILPPDMATLEKRLRERASDPSHSIETRLQNAYNELGWSEKFDHRLVNDDLSRTFQELEKIIRKECL